MEDARRAQLESREAKRAKEEAEEPAETAVDDEEAIASKTPHLQCQLQSSAWLVILPHLLQQHCSAIFYGRNIE